MTNVTTNGNGNGKTTIHLIAGTGILGVVAAGMLAVANDARIAISVAEQHGQEILLLRGEVIALREEIRQRTTDRYTARDHQQFERYLDQRLEQLEKKIENH